MSPHPGRTTNVLTQAISAHHRVLAAKAVSHRIYGKPRESSGAHSTAALSFGERRNCLDTCAGGFVGDEFATHRSSCGSHSRSRTGGVAVCSGRCSPGVVRTGRLYPVANHQGVRCQFDLIQWDHWGRAGQTIGIFEEGSNPSFVSTSSPNYSTSALAVFDKTFGIPDPPSLNFFDENGNPITPTNPGPGDEGAGPEIALDIEWAHAMAPAANIDVVNAVPQPNDYYQDIPLGMATLAKLPGVSVVSASYGWYLEYYDQGALETEWDSEYIQAALAVNPNATFFSSSGDDGSFPDSLIYPSVSPEVVSVGGTSLFLGSQNQWANETGWSGSGGGISTTFTKPSYQDNTGITTAFRTDPDVSAVADPATGVAVYDPFDFGTTTPWEQIGGTSLAAPVWAGMMTIADQGRALFGASPLGSPQTLNYLYSFPQSDFHDVTEGNSGLYSAGPGYDLVTGRGSPIANVVVPALATAGVTVQVVTTQPPTTVIQGGKFGTVVEAQFPATGAIATDFVGNATISLESGPTGATFTPVTVPFTNGVAVFDGLSLSTLSNGTPYTFTITVTSGSLTLRTLTPDSVDVATAATPDVGVYYPLPLDSSLRGDAAAANADPTNATDDLYLVYSTPYDLTAGQLVLHNTSSLPSKTLQFLGDDEFATTTPAISAGSLSRVFDIVGTSPLSVLFNGLVIEGGSASTASTDGAIGGGLLIDGGSVRLSNVTLQGNQASGGAGAVAHRVMR